MEPAEAPEKPRCWRRRARRHSVSWLWPIFMLAVACLAYYIIHVIDHLLPETVSEYEARANPRLFSAERARWTVQNLTRLGPRLAGTVENRELAPAIILDELQRAALAAHGAQSLLFHVQSGSGAYTLEYKPRFTNIYERIQNVVAMLEGSSGEHSILINCHYDTFPTSDGASDDAISCAVMLELVRVFSQESSRLEHNIIFLFNGAEETSLQASHLFLQHPWASTVRAFLNFEAAGVGGRAILFQSGPNHSWLLDYYGRHAVHPHGLVLGEEMFQSGLIPSDSDFRIFRDFLKVPGLDFAFTRNAYLYHTKYDKEEYIPLGSYQHLGDNAVAILRELGRAPELENLEKHKEGKGVYFDYLGWFMVSYSVEAGIGINVTAIFFSFLSVAIFIGRLAQWKWLPQSWWRTGKKSTEERNADHDAPVEEHTTTNNGETKLPTTSKDVKETLNEIKYASKKNHGFAFKEMAIAVVAKVGGMLLGVAFTIAFGLFIDAVSPLAMPWFSNIWLIFPLVWCPCLAGYGLVPVLVNWWRRDKRDLSHSMTTQLNLVATQVPWAIILLVLTAMGIRSAAVVMVPVFFSAAANLIIHLCPIYKTTHTWAWVYLVVHIPSIIFQMYIVLLMYTVFLPIMGRSGPINSDLYIAGISSLLILYSINCVVPFVTLVRRPGLVVGLLLLFALVMLPIALCTNLGHPYRGGPDTPSPQRYWIMHSDREFYNEHGALRRHEQGYFILNLDRNSPRTINLRGLEVYPLAKDCEDELYCGVPMYVARMVPLSLTSSWIPAGAPVIPAPKTRFSLKERTCTSSPPQCTLNFVIEGHNRITVTFAPREGVSVDGWSLPTEPKASGQWKGRPTYFLHIVREDNTEDTKLSITFNVLGDLSGPIVDLALAGNYIHHTSQFTPEFKSFIDSFPDWTTMTAWISSYVSYTL